jgi:hypothetical protein
MLGKSERHLRHAPSLVRSQGLAQPNLGAPRPRPLPRCGVAAAGGVGVGVTPCLAEALAQTQGVMQRQVRALRAARRAVPVSGEAARTIIVVGQAAG